MSIVLNMLMGRSNLNTAWPGSRVSLGLNLYPMILCLFLVLLGCMMSQSLEASSFYKRHAEGWHWYDLQPKEDEQSENFQENPAPLSPTEQLQKQKKELEESLHKAVISANPKDVLVYQQKQKALMDQSQRFAKVWQFSLQMNPQVDERINNPQEQFARHELYAHQKEQREKLIQGLSKEFGLFFFFRSDCRFCSIMAPIVEGFSRVYGWDVLAISVGGGALQEFPKAVPDNGIAQEMQVQAYPALMAVHGKTGQVIPLAYGVASLDEIERRIEAIAPLIQEGLSQ